MNRRFVSGVIAGLMLIAASCGGDDDSGDATVAASDPPVAESDAATDTADETEPIDSGDTTATAGTADETASAEEFPFPTAIVSLSPTATEMLYAIGAGDQVIAVDDFSNYPEEAAAKMNGISGFEPNIEAIAGLEPDLVVTDGTNAELLARLDTLEIPHWEGPAAVEFEDVYRQLDELGEITGHVAEAEQVVGSMQSEIAAVLDELPELPEPLTYYHELDPNGFWSVTSDTFIGLVYSEAGLVNIADEVGEGNPYPQLSAEFIVSADPDLIFLACTKYCGETLETVGARDGWGALSAVVNGNVIEMDDDVASRWGPRIVDYIVQVGDAVEHAAAVATS